MPKITIRRKKDGKRVGVAIKRKPKKVRAKRKRSPKRTYNIKNTV